MQAVVSFAVLGWFRRSTAKSRGTGSWPARWLLGCVDGRTCPQGQRYSPELGRWTKRDPILEEAAVAMNTDKSSYSKCQDVCYAYVDVSLSYPHWSSSFVKYTTKLLCYTKVCCKKNGSK